MVFQELLSYCKAQALKDVLAPSEESLWFGLCMAYSKHFHTPLYKVLKMDPEHVMRAEFANDLEDIDIEKHIEKLLEQIYTLENPNYEKKKEKDLDEFAVQAEKEEEERIKAGKPIPKPKKSPLKNEVTEIESKRTGGSVNFDGLIDEEKPGKF